MNKTIEQMQKLMRKHLQKPMSKLEDEGVHVVVVVVQKGDPPGGAAALSGTVVPSKVLSILKQGVQELEREQHKARAAHLEQRLEARLTSVAARTKSMVN